MAAQAPRSSRVLRIAQVMNMSGLSKASIYRLGKLGRFPLPFRIGISAVGWDEAEIEFWIFERKLDTIH
jgi:prophage regulatory protein